MCWHVYTQVLLETTRTDDNCAFKEGHLTDKSDDRVGHLSTILARGGRNLNYPIIKSSSARGFPGGWGC